MGSVEPLIRDCIEVKPFLPVPCRVVRVLRFVGVGLGWVVFAFAVGVCHPDGVMLVLGDVAVDGDVVVEVGDVAQVKRVLRSIVNFGVAVLRLQSYLKMIIIINGLDGVVTVC